MIFGVIVIIILIVLSYVILSNKNRQIVEDTIEIPMDEISDDTMMDEETSAAPLETSAPSVSMSPTATNSLKAGTVKEFIVTGSNFKFTPTEMRVKQGDTVRVTFKNSTGTHDWKLDEFKAATKVLQGGQEETVEFVASKTGTFEYYCSVGTHRQMGMKGSLVVE